ncbi:metallophosphoesterase family protein [Bradyrhizobium symbiodeficiens]|uniref:metallophosphoesterase family protein n=1 Tax=Bradyrhizobium symbiodeficiens TaxID=1404367 RepID=UPI0030D5EE44
MFRLKRSRKVSHEPRLPEGVRIYAFGDIHGCVDLLHNSFAVIDEDLGRNPVDRAVEVFLGDYIDRGPQSSQTLDLLIERSRMRETICLKGNHEAYFLNVLRDPSKIGDWRQFGGLPTLMSYGINPPLNPTAAERTDLISTLLELMPPSHLQFLRGLKPSFTCGDFYFVHAGVRPGIPLREQQETDLLWIRDEFLESKENFGKFVVHGHTPVEAPDIRHNRINIDTGAYATGNLTLLSIQGSSMLPMPLSAGKSLSGTTP